VFVTMKTRDESDDYLISMLTSLEKTLSMFALSTAVTTK